MTASISVGTTSQNLVDVPIDPNTLVWGLQDISAADAGRVQDANTTMYKDRVGQKRKIQLGWNNPTFAEASQIVQMFNPEYVYVRYMDLLTGGWRTAEFYTGDKNSPYRMVDGFDQTGNRTVMSTLTFDIIER